jgi:hypothetical protein
MREKIAKALKAKASEPLNIDILKITLTEVDPPSAENQGAITFGLKVTVMWPFN